MTDPDPPPRQRLRIGLALSGGGFRASFFHLGVLRRLAELDQLRNVAVLSSVSGGSIVAAHYLLLLAARIAHQSRQLTRDEFISVVDDLETQFCRGTDRNLRNRLFWNPVRNAALFSSSVPLGEAMAALYQHHIFRDATIALNRARPTAFEPPDSAPDSEASSRPPAPSERSSAGNTGRQTDATPLRLFDARFLRGRSGERLPKLILNATSLNSGRNFRMSPTEVGDSELGFVRRDEVHIVLATKRMLASLLDEATALGTVVRRLRSAGLRAFHAPAGGKLFQAPGEPPSELVNHMVSPSIGAHLAFWLAGHDSRAADAPHDSWTQTMASQLPLAQPAGWPLAAVLLPSDAEALHRLEFGAHRRAKIAGWYFARNPREQPSPHARTRLLAQFWSALDDGASTWARNLRQRLGDDDSLHAAFVDLVVDLYYFRSALAFSDDVGVLTKLTLAQAVAASANFPPVFPPYRISGVYDQPASTSLLLTDGGVQDNQGLTALLEEACTHVVVSDAGAPFDIEHVPAYGRLRMMSRLTGLLQDNGRELLLARLREPPQTGSAASTPHGSRATQSFIRRALPPDFAVVALSSNLDPDALAAAGRGVLPVHPDAAVVARIRTDLDAFDADEIDALVYEGYRIAVNELDPLFKTSPPSSALPPRAPVQLDAAFAGPPSPGLALRRLIERVLHGREDRATRRRHVLRAAHASFLRALFRPGLARTVLPIVAFAVVVPLLAGSPSAWPLPLSSSVVDRTHAVARWFAAVSPVGPAAVIEYAGFFPPTWLYRSWRDCAYSGVVTFVGAPTLAAAYLLGSRKWRTVRTVGRRFAITAAWASGLLPLWAGLAVASVGLLAWLNAWLTVRPSTERPVRPTATATSASLSTDA